MVKNLLANAGDVASVPRLGRSPGEGNGHLLGYSTSADTATAKALHSCPTLCDPIPGILQARTLEWVAISFSNA